MNTFDEDAFEERAAIMEYDGGMSRFEAETMAARLQGLERWEAIGEISKRVIERVRNQCEAADGDAEGDMPGMQPGAEKEE